MLLLCITSTRENNDNYYYYIIYYYVSRKGRDESEGRAERKQDILSTGKGKTTVWKRTEYRNTSSPEASRKRQRKIIWRGERRGSLPGFCYALIRTTLLSTTSNA
jgi:hypothetical protein